MADNDKKLILAVDDMVVNLHMMQSILESVYHVSLAKKADIALQILRSVKVDLILLDVEMPDISGFDFLENLKANPEYASIPVIMVTSHGTEDIISKATLGGARDFIVKPVDSASLLQKIKNILE
jgi:CheY-like chemotaxis protein